ncbi:hypothetical protein NQ315_017074 [Exocentrus adspersus]|uniref:Uncharacterized protein n=1 Tax=Exocentrus adspersus TaxID=1586481 RepID=A0AAV8VH28_9CUCU|nr:hypothetical protein NQ315_017074 [Exocentrus adspersus]
MLNSSKISDSPRRNSINLYSNANDTTNGISKSSFMQPKITSTPLIKRDSIFATPPKQKLLSPRRYSLSDIATPPRPDRQDFQSIHPIGPLLASTRYNVNVSTYEDAKSPGLASRIVQYNEEAERQREYASPPTHQAKYGSPGLFPVVHLFKKKLPTLEQKPRRVTIRIASPDYSRHHSHAYNRKLLEGIVKPGTVPNRTSRFSPSSQPGSSTRSVLDALKEISRKRIHANEDYDVNEDSGKRLRMMDNVDSNKRARDNTSLDKSLSPSKPTSKRVCMYDEYAASCSSTDYSSKKVEQSEPKRKSISISTLTENPKEAKQVKLINAETQTVNAEVAQESDATVDESSIDQIKAVASEESVKKKDIPLKIFDDAPLERIRKNRLATLMGSLTGKEPVLLPKPDYATMLNSPVEEPDTLATEVLKSTEKPLVSILSSPNKPSPTKSNKHVHFSVPESTSSQTNLSSASIVSFPSVVSISSVSIPAPASSNSDVRITLEVPSKVTPETPAPPSSAVGLVSSSNTVDALQTGSNSSSVTSIISKESSTTSLVGDSSKSQFTVPNFQFKPAATSAPVVAVASTAPLTFMVPTATSSTSSPPKMGGFKFDLSTPVTALSSAAVSTPPGFGFGSTLQPTKTISDTATTTALIPTTSGMVPKFSFGSKAITTTSNNTTTSTSALSKISSVNTPGSSALTVPSFKFSPSSTENKPASSAASSAGFSLGQTNAVTSTPTFGTNMPLTSVPTFSTSKPPVFSFGAPKTTSTSSTFGTTTSATFAFGTPSTTSSNFATSSTSFLNTSTSSPVTGFGGTASSTSGGFGVPSTSTNAGFASNPTSTFGSNKTVSPFSVSNSTAPVNSLPFGKSTTTQFRQVTSESAFGTPTTTLSFSTSNTFGAAATTTTTSSSVFGNAGTSSSMFKTGNFGAPSNNANIFGGTAINTQPSGFGMSAKATPLPFGTPAKTTTPSFGTNTAPTFNFGAKTTTSPSFGSTNAFGAVTTASTSFGSSTPTPAFGTSNSFSSGATSSFGKSTNAFATSAPQSFGGTTVTTNQQNSFGTTATPSFGATNTGFGAGDKTSVFGNPPNASPFTSTPFANATSTSTFPTSSVFGTSNAVSAFAKPQTTQNAFGTPNSNAFGTSNNFGTTQAPAPAFNSTNAQNAVFSFGATTTPKPPGVFSFGSNASNDIPKPSFNFTGGSGAPPAFGSAPAPPFGGAAPAPFGAAGIPQFNVPQTGTQGMFSIGSGSSSGKSRTHLKPKRRT